MAPPTKHEIDTFVSITGASEAVAARKLEEHNGNLNEAVNAYFSEGDRSTLAASAPPIHNDLMNIDELIDVESSEPVLPIRSSARTFNPFSPLDPTFPRNLFNGSGYGVSSSVPWVSHPKDVRVIPIEVKDGNSQPGSSGPIIEDVTASASAHGPDIRGTVIIDDDDDEVIPVSPPDGGFVDGRLPGPSVMDYNNDIEEQMIQAAIEASKRDAVFQNQQLLVSDNSVGPQLDKISPALEDVDLEHAVAMSLRAAQQENIVGEQGMDIGEQSYNNSSHKQLEVGVAAENGRQGFVSSNIESSSQLHSVDSNRYMQEEDEDVEEEPLTRRRSSRLASRNSASAGFEPVIDSPQTSPEHHGSSSRPQFNRDDFQGDEWGGISSEEHVEAVMLEAALFGGIPEGTGYPFAYPSLQIPQPGSDTSSTLYPLLPRPASPTLTAQRLLREQQDDEYLAALQADREKELKAKQEAEDAVVKERHHDEEIRRKLLEEEESEKKLTEKEASLPQEPSADDENAVTLLVRMPDGSRRGRRFLKNDMLKLLFDYIDVGRVVKPGTYRLVRSYPRRAFTFEEHGSSLSELGLTSKQEALYLELI